MQIALNDAMRIALGKKRRDRVHVADLIKLTGMKSFNRMAAEDMLRLIWQSVHVDSSPLAHIAKKKGNSASDRESRSATRGDLQMEAKTSIGQRNFPEPAIRLWNNSTQAVREAHTRLTAKKEICHYAESLPL